MDADYSALHPHQLINHFKQMGALTTKTGLLRSLYANAHWEGPSRGGLDWQTFLPFCFKIEKNIDIKQFNLLYRIDSCAHIIESFVSINDGIPLRDVKASRSQTNIPLKDILIKAGLSITNVTLPALLLSVQFSQHVASVTDRPGWCSLHCDNEMSTEIDSFVEQFPDSDEEDVSVPMSTSTIASFLKYYQTNLSHQGVSLYVAPQPPYSETILTDYQWYLINPKCMTSHKSVPTSLSQLNSFPFSVPIQQFSTFPRELLNAAKEVLPKLKALTAPLQKLGSTGLWIIKPSGGSCGRAIQMITSLRDLSVYLDGAKDAKHIIQKYIEHPLLIHGYKFDIRQWVLITSHTPLSIWMYTHPYFRIASIPYSTDDTSRYIHLTNHAIQRYSPSYGGTGPEFLRHGCMMNFEQFQEYLSKLDTRELNPSGNAFVTNSPTKDKRIHYSKRFNEFSLPFIEQIVITTIKSGMPDVPQRSHTYDILGFDFMLDDIMNPWLLEVTLSPSFKHDTEIVTPLVEDVMESTMKGLFLFTL